jgi:PAS domain S-box-containing protein
MFSNLNELLSRNNLYYFIKTNVEGSITYANEYYIKLNTSKNNTVIGANYIEVVHPEDKDNCIKVFNKCLQEPEKIHELTIKMAIAGSKSYKDAKWQFIGCKDHDGNIQEIALVGIDVNNFKYGDDKIQNQIGIEFFFNKLPFSGIILNKQYEILNTNQAFCDFTGLSKYYLIGKNIFEIIRKSKEDLYNVLSEAVKKNNAIISVKYFDRIVQKEIALSIYPNEDTIAIIFEDKTFDIENAKQINRYEKIINEIGERAKLGWWEYDTISKKWNISYHANNVFGFKTLNEGSLKKLINLLNYSQKRIFLQGLKDNLNGINTRGSFVINTPSGEQKTVAISGSSETANNKVVKIKGTIQDVTVIKYRERLLRNIMNAGVDKIIVVNKLGQIIFSNTLADHGKINHFKYETIVGTNFYTYFNNEGKAKIKECIEQAFEGVDLSFEHEFTLGKKSYYFEVNVSPVFDVSKEVISVVFKMRNIDDKYAAQKKLQESELNFKKAQKMANMSSFELNFITNTITFPQEILVHWQYLQKNSFNLNELIPMIGFKDQKLVQDNINSVKINKESKDFEFAVNLYEKAKLVIFARIYPVLNEAGEVIYAKGIAQDITLRKKNEIFLESILNSSTYDILVINKNYEIVLFNQKTSFSLENAINEKIKIGDNIFKFIDETQIPYTRKSFMKVFAGGTDTYEANTKLKSGFYQYSRIHNYPIYEPDGSIENIVCTIMNINEQKELQEKLILSEINKERNISKSVVEALESERILLGSELHDNVNQLLGMSKLTLEYVRDHPHSNETMLKATSEYIKEAISEIRRISYNLAPPNLQDIGLNASIKVLLDKLDLSNAFKLDFDFSILENSIHQNIQLGIYRIVQEAMNNIIKHAEATDIKIDIYDTDNIVNVVIEDNGKGFDQTKKANGIGLKNMIFRAQSINGIIEVKSAIGKGTMIHVKIPRENDEAPNTNN